MVHRDLKPGNMVFHRKSTSVRGELVKLERGEAHVRDAQGRMFYSPIGGWALEHAWSYCTGYRSDSEVIDESSPCKLCGERPRNRQGRECPGARDDRCSHEKSGLVSGPGACPICENST